MRLDSKSPLVVAGFGLIVLFAGCAFLVDGAWQTHVRYVRERTWLAVEARVVECAVVQSAASYSQMHTRVRGISFSIHCRFAYDVRGIAYESSAHVGDPIFTTQKGFLIAPKVTAAKLRDWVARHPSGSPLTIHYDPSNPENISLAGADEEVTGMLPHERVIFGSLAATTGLLMILAARVLRKRAMRDSATSPDKQIDAGAAI